MAEYPMEGLTFNQLLIGHLKLFSEKPMKRMNNSKDKNLDKQSTYLATFYFLDRIFWLHQEEKADEVEQEHLGDVLSAMNPHAFADRQAADPAMAADWQIAFANVNVKSNAEIFQGMIAFLESQLDWLELSYPLRLLRQVTIGDKSDEYWRIWLECVDEATSPNSDISRFRLKK